MQLKFVMTVISDDKPGIIETLAQAVSNSQGNWLESNFSQLAGKFTGVVCLQIDASKKQNLFKLLDEAEEQGIQLQIEPDNKSEAANKAAGKYASFSAAGPDKQGIVKEFSQAFAANGINIDSMETKMSSVPYSGEPLFEAKGSLSLPDNTDIDKLESTLNRIADELGLDLSLQV